jgi:hypothetical protein
MGTTRTIRPTEGVNKRMVLDDEDVEGHAFGTGQPAADEVNRRMEPEEVNKRMEPEGVNKRMEPEGVNKRMVVDDQDVEGHSFQTGAPTDDVNRRMEPEGINKRMEPEGINKRMDPEV